MRGFTLVEIILVVLILGIVAGLAVPRFSRTYQQLQLQKTAQDLRDLMRYAQSRAVIKNCQVRLEFAEDRLSYWLAQESAGGADAGGAFERFSGRLGRAFHVPAAIAVTAQEMYTVFYPDGQIDKRDISICHEKRCLVVSTQEQRGHVWILEPQS